MLEMLKEFDEKQYEEGIREEGIEIGIEKGREEERKKTELEREKAELERQRADKAERELNKLLAWAKEHGYKG